MEHNYEKEIEQIIASFDCPKDFICYKSGFTTLCRAEDMGEGPYLECGEKSPGDCMFLLSFAKVHHCDCPFASISRRS